MASMPIGAAQAASPIAAPIALSTLIDGDAFLLRAADRYSLAEGVALLQDDIVEVPAASRLARLEFPDGSMLVLGPGSRALLAPRLAGERASARIYLLTGWAKLSTPKAIHATLLSPALDVGTIGGIVVLAALPDVTHLFAEAGDALPRRNGASTQPLKAGELLSLANTPAARPEIGNRPTGAFVSAMPRSFMDALPSRAAKFQGRPPVAPHRLGALAYADAQPWLDAEPALRRAYVPRWRALARDAEFRRGLVAGLKSHPEWEPILFPPVDKRNTTASIPGKSTP